jgi:hypothetical protein
MKDKSITELREIVRVAATGVGSIEGEALLALSERITRIEETLFKLSKRVTGSQTIAAKVDQIFDEAKKPDGQR